MIERRFCHLKQWRGLATRYDKLAIVYRAAADARPPSAARTPHASLGRAPVVPLLGTLLTRGSFPDLCSSRAPAPAPHNNDENAQDDEKDPNQKQDIADLVDVESRSMH